MASSVTLIPLLGEIIHLAHLFDQFKLALEPMLIPFFRRKHLLQHLTAPVVAELCRQRDHSVEAPDRYGFDIEIKLELVKTRSPTRVFSSRVRFGTPSR
jgi:hypothetical protein